VKQAAGHGWTPGRQRVELIPSPMAALRVSVGRTGRFRVPPAAGPAEQVKAASCDRGIERWQLYLTQEQIDSVVYGAWPRRMTGSTGEGPGRCGTGSLIKVMPSPFLGVVADFA
jgi:hypothetical protein